MKFSSENIVHGNLVNIHLGHHCLRCTTTVPKSKLLDQVIFSIHKNIFARQNVIWKRFFLSSRLCLYSIIEYTIFHKSLIFRQINLFHSTIHTYHNHHQRQVLLRDISKEVNVVLILKGKMNIP